MSSRETRDDIMGLTPLKRAEEIVRRGPNPDGGKQPCEPPQESSCLTFQQLNRMRFFRADCGCLHRTDLGDAAGRDMIATPDNLVHPCNEHGGELTREQEKEWVRHVQFDDFTIAGMDGGLAAEDKD